MQIAAGLLNKTVQTVDGFQGAVYEFVVMDNNVILHLYSPGEDDYTDVPLNQVKLT